MSRSRRKRRTETKMPATTRAYVVSVVGLVSIGLWIVFYAVAVWTSGNTMHVFGAVGTVILVVTVIALVQGVREFKDTAHHLVSRVIALVSPLVAFLFWAFFYSIGLLNR